MITPTTSNICPVKVQINHENNLHGFLVTSDGAMQCVHPTKTAAEMYQEQCLRDINAPIERAKQNVNELTIENADDDTTDSQDALHRNEKNIDSNSSYCKNWILQSELRIRKAVYV